MADARGLDRPAVPRAAGGVLLPRHQPGRRGALPRRRGGPHADRAQQRAVGGELLADADSAVHPDGRGAVPHRPRGEGDRRRRAPDPPGAGPPRGRRGGGGHRVLRDLRLDHRHHRDARQPDAAGDARARLSPDHGHRADHGDRRGRHADSALGAHRAARQPVGHLDLQAADRRRDPGPDPEPRLHRLHRGAREAEPVARAGDARSPNTSGWEKLRPFFQYVLPLVSIFVVVVASMSPAGRRRPSRRRSARSSR